MIVAGHDGVLDFDREAGRMDDLYWARRVWQEPFSWALFYHWWVARRWLIPRDVRRR